MGDSDITRFPHINDRITQANSYPGTKIEQALHLWRNKTPTSPVVKRVILAFAWNNCWDRDLTLVKCGRTNIFLWEGLPPID